MPDEVVFNVTESLFQKLVEWQDKIEKGEITLPEEGETPLAPEPEQAEKTPSQTDVAD